MATIYDLKDGQIAGFIKLLKASVDSEATFTNMPGELKKGIDLDHESAKVGLVAGMLLMCDPDMRRAVDLILEVEVLNGRMRREP
jgi:hypothetical protein